MLRHASVSFVGALLVVVGWSVETQAEALVVAAESVLYLAPLAVGATGWRAALMLPVWVFAGAVAANYGPAPMAWDMKAGISVPIFAGAIACAAATARTAVLALARGRRIPRRGLDSRLRVSPQERPRGDAA